MNSKPVPRYLGIGEVLAELRAEFPDVRVSKIRFLESEGLVSPARSPSGYRRFAPSDVERLRAILTAQRDEYLPLRVIRERLTEAGQRPAPAAGRGSPPAPSAPMTAEMVSRRELLDAAGIDDSQLDELEAHGLVRRVGRLYGQDALDVAMAAAALAAYGVQPRHLRAARTAAERDTALIEQVVAPMLRQRNPAARGAATATAGQIAALLLRLHQALVQTTLAEAGLPGHELAGQPDSGRGGERRDAGEGAASRQFPAAMARRTADNSRADARGA
jgi:DNA-binding transcriptional MerR regulator